MADKYSSFSELAANERLHIDYQIRILDRHSEVIIFAPHGGWIEPNTAELAEAIAGQDFSFYAFEALKNAPHGHYHITSHRFDEPKAIELLSRSRIAVAIHGRRNEGSDSIWLGGLAVELRDAIGASLADAGFKAELNSRLQGQNTTNICNRTSSGEGVQLELSKDLRDQLATSSELLSAFCGAVRTSVVEASSKRTC
ncbi:poly-gamma-glutamate hydrolase family protein [Roseobacter sp. YSTF-M11]|uniref:Poly-gamma-glutamate hydrolase family protein n=1 Tax=Roseobacter insulae TaxID=2859783 RepID=A0A9X1K1C5_9RHOB|nr:poly-gamma-glutamate hydrolase family protein [Roseobacter insulae]MBW4706392.1 poly-gamma-glutamate hydrolase family protein [Roseobacter insulae]